MRKDGISGDSPTGGGLWKAQAGPSSETVGYRLRTSRQRMVRTENFLGFHLPGPFHFRGIFSFSLLEVLVSLLILLLGILAILLYFPNVLRANDRAMMLSEAAFLAQRKAEEIRRDTDQARRLIVEIRRRSVPTAPVVFPENPNLTYSFCGVSLLDPTDDPGDPADDRGVPRIIVQFAQGYRADSRPLYELRFNE